MNRKKENRSGRHEKLSAYLDGELAARQRIKLEKELAQDPSLRRELEELRRTTQMLRSLPTLAVPRSFTLDPVVYGRVKPRRFYLYPVMRAATVVAMLVFAFLFAGDLLVGGGLGMPAAAPDAEWMAAQKEVVVTEGPESAPMADEVAGEPPMALMAEPVEEGAEVREFDAPAETVVETIAETVVEEMAVETEAEHAPTAEMPAAELAENDTTAPPVAEPAEGGVSAGGALPTATATPGPAPTLSPTEVASKVIVPTASPTREAVPTALSTEPTPAPSVGGAANTVPAGEDSPAPTEAIQETELDQSRDGGTDWGMIGKLGMGVLAAGLLIVTLIARRYNW